MVFVNSVVTVKTKLDAKSLGFVSPAQSDTAEQEAPSLKEEEKSDAKTSKKKTNK